MGRFHEIPKDTTLENWHGEHRKWVVWDSAGHEVLAECEDCTTAQLVADALDAYVKDESE